MDGCFPLFRHSLAFWLALNILWISLRSVLSELQVSSNLTVAFQLGVCSGHTGNSLSSSPSPSVIEITCFLMEPCTCHLNKISTGYWNDVVHVVCESSLISLFTTISVTKRTPRVKCMEWNCTFWLQQCLTESNYTLGTCALFCKQTLLWLLPSVM